MTISSATEQKPAAQKKRLEFPVVPGAQAPWSQDVFNGSVSLIEPLQPLGHDNVLETILSTRPGELPEDLRATLSGHLSCVAHAFSDHATFMAHYKLDDSDFVYDKASGIYLVCTTGRHTHLLALLSWSLGCKDADLYTAADNFILAGHGIFKSRAGRHIYRTASYSVSPELAPILRDFEVLENCR